MPLDLMQELTGYILKGASKAWLTTFTIRELDKRLAEQKAEQKAMNLCANRNSKGQEYEKAGKISLAIRTYEKNIEGDECYPALHSFERLMIIYRKQKRYDDEIRVIDRAINVLCPRYPDLLEKYQKRKLKAESLLAKSTNKSK